MKENNKEKQMGRINDISNYISTINLGEVNSLIFLSEDNLRTNPYHKYVIRKIISQLEVRDHIHFLEPVLGENCPERLLRTIST